MAGLVQALQALLEPRGLVLPIADTETVPPDPAPKLLPALGAIDTALATLRQEAAVLKHQDLLLQAAQQSGHAKASNQVLARVGERSIVVRDRIGQLQTQRRRVLTRIEEDSHSRSLAGSGMDRPRFSIAGPSGPLGKRAAGLLREAQAQTLDRLLHQEQSTGQALWPLKDRLDELDESLLTVERRPLAEGWPAMLHVLAELKKISVAVSGPSSHERDGQKEHNKAAE